MRINVYAEELTEETQLVTKVVDAGTPQERTFYGIRLFLASPPELHYSEDDDDRSAITFWVPWTKADGHDFHKVGRVLESLLNQLGTGLSQELLNRVNARTEQRAPAAV